MATINEELTDLRDRVTDMEQHQETFQEKLSNLKLVVVGIICFISGYCCMLAFG